MTSKRVCTFSISGLKSEAQAQGPHDFAWKLLLVTNPSTGTHITSRAPRGRKQERKKRRLWQLKTSSLRAFKRPSRPSQGLLRAPSIWGHRTCGSKASKSVKEGGRPFLLSSVFSEKRTFSIRNPCESM